MLRQGKLHHNDDASHQNRGENRGKVMNDDEIPRLPGRFDWARVKMLIPNRNRRKVFLFLTVWACLVPAKKRLTDSHPLTILYTMPLWDWRNLPRLKSYPATSHVLFASIVKVQRGIFYCSFAPIATTPSISTPAEAFEPRKCE